jgi:hypothetical protein
MLAALNEIGDDAFSGHSADLLLSSHRLFRDPIPIVKKNLLVVVSSSFAGDDYRGITIFSARLRQTGSDFPKRQSSSQLQILYYERRFGFLRL